MNNCRENKQLKKSGINIEIDDDFLTEFINTYINDTVTNEAHSIAVDEVKKIVDNEVKEKIKTAISEKIDKFTEDAINKFLNRKVVVGDGRNSPIREMTMSQHLYEEVQKNLNKKYKEYELDVVVYNIVQSRMIHFSNDLKREVNEGIRKRFEKAITKTLGDEVVSLLMGSDTDNALKILTKNMGELLALPQEGEQ